MNAPGVGAGRGLVQPLEGRNDAALGLVRRPGLELAHAAAEESGVAVGAALEAADVLQLLAAALAAGADAPDLSAVLLEVLQQPHLRGGRRILAHLVVRLLVRHRALPVNI